MQMTNLQIELLKTFSFNLSDNQLLEIKELLSKYFASRVSNEMDKFVDDNGWDDEKFEELANEHLRTDYR